MKFLNIYSKVFCFVQFMALLLFVCPVMAEGDFSASVFLEENHWTGDLDQLKEKGAIRILVPVSNPDFFIDGFRKYGNTPAILKKFQEYLNERVESGTFIRVIMIPASRVAIMDRLIAGYGDLVVANLTITEERLKKVDFATPINTGVKEIIVAAPDSPVLRSLNDLSGKKVYTRPFSSYHEHLLRLNRKLEAQGLAPVVIEAVADELEDDDLLAIVSEGLVPYMVLDHRKMDLWQDVYRGAVPYPNLAIDTGGEIAWVLRKNSPQLLDIVSSFSLAQQNAPVDMAALRKSTEKEVVRFLNLEEENIQKFVQLYPLFSKVGAEYNIPPLMLAALAFERSGFDETVAGKNGELGLMQLAPFIEREADIKSADEDTEEIELHVTAATKYLSHLRDVEFKDLANDPKQQLFFMIAAYLNGPEKINGMRWTTAKTGKNQNEWFNDVNVTVARLIGRESVRAVRKIALYWVTYRMAIDSGRIVSPENIQ